MKCDYCSEPIAARRKFCNTECQQALYRAERVRVWLETGVGKPASLKGHYIRNYIEKDQNGLCSLCSGTMEHNGKPLVFILDHIDGDSTNNRRDNLRLVCPNCDSQLDTYKAKNRGNGRHSRRQRYADGVSY